jgi:predicted alpha/beta superfamily hydrolase
VGEFLQELEKLNHTLTGTLRLHHAFQSRFVEPARDIIVYLPPGYLAIPERRYPVLYLHDGQNLFNPATAFAGNEWGLRKLGEELILTGLIEPLVIVGIYNAGAGRLSEYTHVRDRRGQGGRARSYAKFVIEEVKPFIDGKYRTLPDAANTALGGSSLGGLVTLYIGLRFPRVFAKLLVMSPSVWWANRAILGHVRRLRRQSDQKIWLDVGTCEGQNPAASVKNVEDLRDALLGKGWQLERDLKFVKDAGAGHDEKAWGFRMRDALKFLFPADTRST